MGLLSCSSIFYWGGGGVLNECACDVT
jgi:hypothetical protein